MDISDAKNKSYFFSFPFWIFVERNSELQVAEIDIGDTRFRVYPLFRSGKDNQIPMPFIDERKVPSVFGVENMEAISFINLSPVPLLQCDGGPGLAMSWNDLGAGATPRISQAMDSLRIDVLGEMASNNVVYDLLDNIRAITKQWWVLQSIDPLVGYLRNTVSIEENGEMTGLSEAVTSQKIPFGFENPLNQELWGEAITRTFRGVKPSLHLLEILDAYYYINANNYRKVILHASFACEQSVSISYDAICKNKGVKFRHGKHLTGNNFTKHISRDIKKLTGDRDYKKEHGEHYENMEILVNLRGNVAHGKGAEYVRNNELVCMDDKLAMSILSSVTHCIRWLFSVAGLETKD